LASRPGKIKKSDTKRYRIFVGLSGGTQLASQSALLGDKRLRTFLLKTAVQAVFFTQKALLGFKSLQKNKNKDALRTSLFLLV